MIDQVGISIEVDEAARRRQRCNKRVEMLKATKFPRSEDPPSQPTLLQQLFVKKNSEIFELFKVVENGNVDKFLEELEKLSSEKNLPLSAIFDQVTPKGDSLLHLAAYFEKAEIAELIGHHFPELLTKTNFKGDTPLHIAARERNAKVIELILSQYAAYKSKSCTENSKDEEITRITNECGNMAFHEAVSCKHIEGVTLLFEADKYVAHYLNKSGKSPLYLAVLTSDKEIVDVMLKAPFPDDKMLPNCHGSSPLHAAIYTKSADLLKEILDKRPDLMYLKDEDGGTPLHYAATRGYVEGVCMLLKESTLTALEWNTKGHLPIHLACKWGNVKVLKVFLNQEWADSRVLYNRKGQNILHVAANNGRTFVVKYLLRKRELMKYILNEKDKNGNTPLHLAAKNCFPQVIFHLTQEKSIDLNIMNNEGFTARDIIWVTAQMPRPFRERISSVTLYAAGTKLSDKALSIIHKRRVPPKVEWIKDEVDTLMLVAILIVTVTFAAGFTVPGSVYSSDDSNAHERGMAVLSKRTMFKVFVVLNTVAMYSSIFASFLLLWPHIGDFYLAAITWSLALLMVGVALLTMNVAFMAAVSLVVSNVPGLSNFIIIMGILSSFFMFGLGLSGVFPLGLRIPLLSNLVLRIAISPYVLLRPSKPKVKKLQNSVSQAHQLRANEEAIRV